MSRRILRSALIGAAAISALAISEPALGYTELKVTGTVGAHSLADTKTGPGAFCTYKNDSTGAYKLRHLNVHAPKMRAASGQGNEKVGWSFTIQRQDVDGLTKTTWMKRYASPIFASTTDSAHDAAFNDEGVKVIVPYADTSSTRSKYRAIVTLVWYAGNGTSVFGSAKERVDWYGGDHLIGEPSNHAFCNGYV